MKATAGSTLAPIEEEKKELEETKADLKKEADPPKKKKSKTAKVAKPA